MNKQQLLRLPISTIIAALFIQACNAQELGVRMHQVVNSYADTGWFMGSVLVAQDGEVLLNQGYGYANLEWKMPNSATTRFQLASITKQFTAASILLLEDRGKLKTDDSVKKYLPFAPAAWDDITIYNLLTHTSGIADDAAEYEPGPPNRLVFRDRLPKFKPGEKWAYTNLGYIVLGYLLEKVSGQTYADFVQQNIFKPLGMNDSGLDSNVAIIPRRASGYWPGASRLENAERPDLASGFSAGSLYSTTQDLLRWEQGLFGGKVLTPASLHKMITPFKSDYACGLHIKRVNGRVVIEHDGNNIGFNTDIAFYPEDKLSVIVLGNLNNAQTGKMTRALAAVVHGERVDVSARKEISLPHEALSRYVGTYRFSKYDFAIMLEGSHLIGHFPNGRKVPMFPESETRFFSRISDLQFEFSKNDSGEFGLVTQRQNGKEMKGQKK